MINKKILTAAILTSVALIATSPIHASFMNPSALATDLQEENKHPFETKPLSCADGRYENSFLGKLPTDIVRHEFFSRASKQLMSTSKVLYTEITGFTEYQEGSDKRPTNKAYFQNIYVDATRFSLNNFTSVDVPSFTWSSLLYSVRDLHYSYWEDIKGTKISDLYLGHNDLHDDHLFYLAPCLEGTEIIEINLSGNNFSVNALNEFFEKSKKSKLKSLTLDNNLHDVKFILPDLNIDNHNISSLNLASNIITDEGLIHLFRILESSNITFLSLQENEISDEGLKYIFEHINNTKISELHLFLNNITDDGARYALENFKDIELERLLLWGDDISEDIADELENLS